MMLHVYSFLMCMFVRVQMNVYPLSATCAFRWALQSMLQILFTTPSTLSWSTIILRKVVGTASATYELCMKMVIQPLHL